MKRIRTTIHVILSSMVAAVGLTSCEAPMVKYGVPDDPGYIDTTVRCMYGVDPTPIYQLDDTQE